MSSLLWQHSRAFRYIREKLQSYMFSQAFNRKQILREPAKWAAYFIFIHREAKVEMNIEYTILYELLESIDPNIWVQNRDVVDLLLEGLIKYSRELCT